MFEHFCVNLLLNKLISVVCKRIRTSHKGGEPKNSPKSMDLPLLDRVLSWMNLGKKDNEGSLEGTFKP